MTTKEMKRQLELLQVAVKNGTPCTIAPGVILTANKAKDQLERLSILLAERTELVNQIKTA